MSTVGKFEDPPKMRSKRGASLWLPKVAFLKKRPGQPGRIKDCSTAAVAYETAKRIQRYVGDEYEVIGAKTPDGKGAVFARFVGES